MKSADVIVIGLGVHGSAAARELAARGWRVLGVEHSRHGQVRGASRGPMRMVRLADPQQARLAPLAMESFEHWQALSRVRGKPLLRPAPGVIVEPGGERRGSAAAAGQLRHLAADDPLLNGVAVRPGWVARKDSACGLLDAPASVRACVTKPSLREPS
ncbi:FAD-dependent oxidoreductase [Streptomyces sp. NPDC004752]